MIALLLASSARAACTIVTGASVHLDAGPTTTNVVWVGGKIASIGPAAGAPRGQTCTTVAGAGKVLTAGLVAVPTQIGLVEVSLEPSARGADPETPDDAIRGALYAAEGYDPLSTLVRVTRLDGITTALTVPSGGFVSGHAALVALDGSSQAEALVDRAPALVVTLPTASFAEGLHQLRELAADVRAFAARPAAYDVGRPFYAGASRLDLAALRPAFEGRQPILIGANRAADLEALIRIQAELKLRFVIIGAAEGWMVAEALAAAKIPVIIDPLLYGPHTFDTLHARRDNAALLARAGAQVIIGPPERTHNVRSLRETAGNAVREGMDHTAALAAITRTPAAALGHTERGRIAVGAVADLVLWSGDPLELSSAAEQVWIEGNPVDLRSRQTALFEKYRTMPGTPAPALPLTR